MKYPLSFRDKCDGNGCGGMRRQKNDGSCTVIFQNTVVNAPYTISVFRRFSPYTIKDIYDRNTVTCNTAKYGRIRHRIRSFAAVYRVRNHRPG
jgi:hypothetical protein